MKKLQYERPLIQRLNTGLMNKFGMKTEYTPHTHIDEVSVKSLIKEFGSPLFVISEKTIRNTYKEANRAFKPVTRKCSLRGATKQITSMRFAMFFTRKVRGLKWFQVLSITKH